MQVGGVQPKIMCYYEEFGPVMYGCSRTGWLETESKGQSADPGLPGKRPLNSVSSLNSIKQKMKPLSWL